MGVRCNYMIHTDMKMKLIITYDPARDAENHMRSIFDAAYIPHGRVNFTETILGMVKNKEIKNILLDKGDRTEMLNKITALLAESNDRKKIEEDAHNLISAWNRLGDQVVFQLESLYNRAWPFEIMHVDLTTLPMCPYDFNAKRIFIHAGTDTQRQLRILSHELNHFLFYVVYTKELFERLGQEKFELLKESMTIFTNPEQSGKPNEAPLRQLYIKKAVKSINEAVAVGADWLLHNDGV